MDAIYGWMARRPGAARLWIIAGIIVIIAILMASTLLFIPGFLDSIRQLHREDPTLFFGFVVAPGVFTTVCALIWGVGSAWEMLGDALYIGKDEEGGD